MMIFEIGNFSIFNQINELGKNLTGLKILGTLTGPCQFKSGPGHQVNSLIVRKNAAKLNTGAHLLDRIVSAFSTISAETPRDRERQEKTSSDVTMMSTRTHHRAQNRASRVAQIVHFWTGSP